MKIKVTRPDGTIVEAEGTAEECAAITDERKPRGTVVVNIDAPYITPRSDLARGLRQSVRLASLHRPC